LRRQERKRNTDGGPERSLKRCIPRAALLAGRNAPSYMSRNPHRGPWTTWRCVTR